MKIVTLYRGKNVTDVVFKCKGCGEKVPKISYKFCPCCGHEYDKENLKKIADSVRDESWL